MIHSQTTLVCDRSVRGDQATRFGSAEIRLRKKPPSGSVFFKTATLNSGGLCLPRQRVVVDEALPIVQPVFIENMR